MTTQNTAAENLKLEQGEVDSILDRGIEFTVRKKKFVITKPFLGTMDIASELCLKMAYDEDRLTGDETTLAAHEIVAKSAKNSALLISVMVLNSKFKIRWFSKMLAKWFYWNMQAVELKKLAQIIIEDSSIVDFILSIRLVAGMRRTTKPNLIEKSSKV